MEHVEGFVHVDAQAPETVPAFEDVDAFVDRLDATAAGHGASVQVLDARYVAGRDHVESAVDHARRAHDRGDAIARDLGVEILLYAAGRRQIERALEMGIGTGRTPVVVPVVGGDERAAADAVAGLVEPADTLQRGEPECIRRFFDVGDLELAATAAPLEALVCERVALLAVEK